MLPKNDFGRIENELFWKNELYHVILHEQIHGKIPGNLEKVKIFAK